MTCFRLPDDMCRRLSRRMIDFWWGQVGDRKKVHWTTRQSLCLPQSEGGLGLRDFKLFNRALLASHYWRLLEKPNCMLAQILKARYHPTENFLCAVAGSRPSWGWQSLLHGRSLLLRGLRRQIGDGSSTYIMRNPWIPGQKLSCPTPRTGTLYSGPSLVSDLFANGRWNLDLLHNHFSPASVDLIRSIPLPLNPAPDRWIWHYSPNGIFSTSSAFRYAQRRPLASEETSASPADSSLWHSVWSLPVLPKLRFFLWRMLLRILPTCEGLIYHHVDVDPICLVCLNAEETIEHLFFACPLALRLGAITDLAPSRALTLILPSPRGSLCDPTLLWDLQHFFSGGTFGNLGI
ncbi:Uncharacterized mitochondrial protein AtMg00310 [Linum grandiflorum]